MSSDEPLLRAILADPNDDAPRLIYADWLDERGQCERAEFIRLQCELSRLPRHDSRRRGLRRRCAEILRTHGREWLRPLQDAVSRCTFRRGFPYRVTMTATNYLRYGATLRNTLPLQQTLVRVPPAIIAQIPESVARECVFLPLAATRRRLWLGIGNVNDNDTLAKVAFILSREVVPVPMRPEDIRAAIHHHYPCDIEPIDTCSFVDMNEAFDTDPDDAFTPVSRLVILILREAVGQNASSVRIEAAEDYLAVFYRIDGTWVE